MALYEVYLKVKKASCTLNNEEPRDDFGASAISWRRAMGVVSHDLNEPGDLID